MREDWGGGVGGDTTCAIGDGILYYKVFKKD